MASPFANQEIGEEYRRTYHAHGYGQTIAGGIFKI